MIGVKSFVNIPSLLLGLIERGDLPSKNGEYGIRRIAGFKLGSKRMGGDVFPE